MGLKRMLWRNTGLGMAIDTIKNIVEEDGVMEGVKRTAKDYVCEDNPITSSVYRSGKYDGKLEGYEEASGEYKEKLLKQADEFLKQKNIYESKRDAYEALLDAYEAEIDTLLERVNRTEAENEYLQQLIIRDRKLRKMAS